MTVFCSKIKQECLIIDFQTWHMAPFPILFPIRRSPDISALSFQCALTGMLQLVQKAWSGCSCRIDLCWAQSELIGWRKGCCLWTELLQLDPRRDVSAQNVSDFHLGRIRQNWHLMQIIKGGVWYWEREFIYFCHIREEWLT